MSGTNTRSLFLIWKLILITESHWFPCFDFSIHVMILWHNKMLMRLYEWWIKKQQTVLTYFCPLSGIGCHPLFLIGGQFYFIFIFFLNDCEVKNWDGEGWSRVSTWSGTWFVGLILFFSWHQVFESEFIYDASQSRVRNWYVWKVSGWFSGVLNVSIWLVIKSQNYTQRGIILFLIIGEKGAYKLF